MVARDTAWPSGTPCWVDLGVDDIVKASAFYAGLFGWEIQAGPPEAGGYVMCLTNGRPVAGIGPKQGPPGTPPAWTTYLAADDADNTARMVKTAGGQVLMEPMDVMDVGRMAVAADPGGAVFGIWQARTHIGVGLAVMGHELLHESRIGFVDQSLAFGRDGAENQGGLARARHPGKHGDPALGNIERDVLEIVLPRAADGDRTVVGVGHRMVLSHLI